MGQKTHPTGFRVGIIKPWLSSWFANKKEYPLNLAEDAKIRKFLKKKLYHAGISRILIDRKAQDAVISIISAKPGIIVGRGGQGIDDLRKEISAKFNRKVQIDVLEVDKVDADAQLVAESIAQQLEKRVVFRRAMKQAIQRSMRAGVLGIKVAVSGRLGGAEIARTEWSKEGRIPLQTLRADVDYGFTEADTIMGIIGVKVWIFKGEILPGEKVDQNIKSKKVSLDGAGAPANRRGGKKRGK
ncbi:MAG: 30S ribosomal protein S3 [Candidatus Gastranaerophilales bacterium]|nr:30S ribosomal protein S3 [Candidatus Gastranaerophilales bacterium]